MAATHPQPAGRYIWYGIFGAPVAFGIQEILNWLISSGACPSGSPGDVGGIALFTNTRDILWGIGGGAFIVAVGAFLVGFNAWRQSHDPSFLSIRSERRSDYLAAAAMLVSGIFIIAILWQTVGIFVLPQCEIMR